MKIDFLCSNDRGSPLGVTVDSLWGRDHRTGIGGSEAAMLTLCELWTEKGYTVRLYNNPYSQGVSEFEQLPINDFVPNEDRDVLIVFRVPHDIALWSKGLKVFLSFDQFTSRPFLPFINKVDKVVGISKYHSDHFKAVYDFDDMITIDLPIRVRDFDGINVKKIPNRLIYTSVPERGLMNILEMWPRIRQRVPDATIRITSDYRLWGLGHPNNEKYLSEFIGVEGVIFPVNTALLREDYLKELCKAEILLYPHQSENPELFCISVAEAQYAGVYPVTSDIGAVGTTNMGCVIPGDPTNGLWRNSCISKVVELLTDKEGLEELQEDVSYKAWQRFHPNTVLKQWEEKVFA